MADYVMKPLPDSVKKLIEGKTFADVATIIPDGSPQVTQTWVDHEGDLVLVNTFEGSQKSRNVRRNPKVALTVTDPSDPSIVRGRVKEVTFNGAEPHVDRMAKKGSGADKYPSESGREMGPDQDRSYTRDTTPHTNTTIENQDRKNQGNLAQRVLIVIGYAKIAEMMMRLDQ